MSGRGMFEHTTFVSLATTPHPSSPEEGTTLGIRRRWQHWVLGGRDCNREQSRFFVTLLVADNGNTRKNSDPSEIPYSSLLFPFFPFISVSFRCWSSNSIAPAFLLKSTQSVGALFLARKSIAFRLQKHCSQRLKSMLPASESIALSISKHSSWRLKA